MGFNSFLYSIKFLTYNHQHKIFYNNNLISLKNIENYGRYQAFFGMNWVRFPVPLGSQTKNANDFLLLILKHFIL